MITNQNVTRSVKLYESYRAKNIMNTDKYANKYTNKQGKFLPVE